MSDLNVSMAEVNHFVAAPNDLFYVANARNYPDDGLADDDSWVENISQGGDDLNEFDSVSETNLETDREEDLRGFNCSAIDFTLHTIVEESCEDSEFEHSYNGLNDTKDRNLSDNRISPSDLEKYFFFGLGDGGGSNTLEDSSSEICSDCSDNGDTIGMNDVYLSDTKSALDLSTSRLEKYFLSGFMGFRTENKSDGSVGSDSEGQPSPSQRKKKFVRARGTPRSTNSSLDNLLVEPVDLAVELSAESLDSSESETGSFSEAGTICDKLDNSDTIKRKKNYRKREMLDQRLNPECGNTSNYLQSAESAKYQIKYINTDSIPQQDLEDFKVNGFRKIPSIAAKTSLVRKDSFNNWSSDEETNLMMSKMRQFFKSLIAVTTHNYTQTNNFGTYSEEFFPERRAQCKNNFQFPYFENELIRLMKTVPGINNQQVREIVEYFSSEDTWSDSNDSSDYNGSNIEEVSKKSKFDHQECKRSIKTDSAEMIDGGVKEHCSLSTETVLVYTNLIESLLANNSKLNSEVLNIDKRSINNMYNDKSQQLLANVMQHIGTKLVALMHDVSIGSDSFSAKNPEIQQHKNITNLEENSTKTASDPVDYSSSTHNQWGNLPRSKSHDVLLGSTSRSWHFNSSNAVNDNTGETSDCDRFSWRGSFESALLAPGDSRSKLLTIDRDNCSLTSEVSISKRGSVDNFTRNMIQTGEQLDRVQSCGSIGVVDKQSCPEVHNQWLSSLSDIKNKSDLETPSPRTVIENFICTNSLPRLQSLVFASNITDKSQSDNSVLQSNAKSARYRSPVAHTNILSSSLSKQGNLQTSGLHHINNLQRSLTSSTSLDDFSISEFSSNINKSPGLQRKQVYKRNNTNFGMRSDSLTSVYSDAFDNRYGSVKVKGQVEFAMQYNYKISAFEVHIKKCKDLAAVDTKRCKSDPYVKVYLLPDKSKGGKRKTKVKKHTLNPVFDEIMRFYVSISNLETRSIWLTVWHSDMFGRNDFLGEVTIDLQGKVFDNPQSLWYMLQEKNGKNDENVTYGGDIVVGLKFISLECSQVPIADPGLSKIGSIKRYSKGQLHILVKEAKNLHSLRASGTCDTFCKSYLLPNRTRSSKQKTPVFKKSLNPSWNFTFVYEDVTLQELSERALELTIWDHDRLISNQFLGGARFSLGTEQVLLRPQHLHRRHCQWHQQMKKQRQIQVISSMQTIQKATSLVLRTLIMWKKKKYQQKYRRAWEKEFQWLQSVNDNAYCKTCSKKPVNCKYLLSRHEKRECHLRNQERLKKTLTITQCCGNKATKHTRLRGEIRLVMYSVKHNLPLTQMDFLPSLINSFLKDTTAVDCVKCGRKKGTSIINRILGPFVLETISKDLINTKYSIIVDEATDVSSKSQ